MNSRQPLRRNDMFIIYAIGVIVLADIVLGALIRLAAWIVFD